MESIVLALALVVATSGEETPLKEVDQYPFVVSIHRNAKTRNFLCAGSLIASSWVLTTANCLPKFACKVRYGDMAKHATYSKILKRLHHMSSRSIYNPETPKNRLTPKANNIGLAHIQEILNITFGMLSGIDYTAIISREVKIFEFNFLPVYKSKIYEVNRKRLVPFEKRKKKRKPLFARFEGDKHSEVFIPHDTKVLRTATGVAIECPMKHFAGPNICVANKCFDIEVDDDPRTKILAPDYGAPLVHGDMIVGVTTEVEPYYSRYTPISPYLTWISQQMTSVTPKQKRKRTF